MRKLYHGTSADNLESILKNGFNGLLGRQVWKCSAGWSYFWDRDELCRAEGFGGDDDDVLYLCISRAAESAECALARSKDCRRVVFEVEVDDEMVSPDKSCENMDTSGAVMASSPVPPRYITRFWIDDEDLSFFKPYFAAIMSGRDLASHLNLTQAEEAMVEAISKSGDTMHSIFEKLSEMAGEMAGPFTPDNYVAKAA